LKKIEESNGRIRVISRDEIRRHLTDGRFGYDIILRPHPSEIQSNNDSWVTNTSVDEYEIRYLKPFEERSLSHRDIAILKYFSPFWDDLKKKYPYLVTSVGECDNSSKKSTTTTSEVASAETETCITLRKNSETSSVAANPEINSTNKTTPTHEEDTTTTDSQNDIVPRFLGI